MEEVTREQVAEGLSILVRHGLLDINIREDGEWLYGLSEKAKSMSTQELEELVVEIHRQEYPAGEDS